MIQPLHLVVQWLVLDLMYDLAGAPWWFELGDDAFACEGWFVVPYKHLFARAELGTFFSVTLLAGDAVGGVFHVL